MTSATQARLRALLQAPREERNEAIEALLLSLDDDPGENVDQETWERSWAAELERRLAETDAGVPADEVFSAGRARLLERMQGRRLRVIAIAHGKRRTGYWLGRVSR